MERAALAKSAKSAVTQKSLIEQPASSAQTDLRKTVITSSTAAAKSGSSNTAPGNSAPVGAAHTTGVKLGNEKATGRK